MSQSSKKPTTDNRSTIVKGFVKPEIPIFPKTKAGNFKPNARFQSVNRGRR